MKKTVLITGASGGIGSATAKCFALNGYEVILHYNNNSKDIDSLKKLFDKNNIISHSFKADLSNDSEIIALAEFAVKKGVDVLINNAGISHTTLFTDDSLESISKITDINLNGAMKLSRLIVPSMITRKSGNIINISSIWGECGASCEVVYSAAKAGLIGFTKALAKELAPSGIRVNCISPGVIDTPMMSEHTEKTIKTIKEEIPLGRLGEGTDVANCALFLCSSKADYITGQVLSVNGGYCI